jgi:hypothetical protein
MDTNLMQEEMLMMKEGTMKVRPRLYEVLVKAVREEKPDTEIVKEIANFAYLPEFSLSNDGSSMVAPIYFMMEVEQELGQEYREVFLGAIGTEISENVVENMEGIAEVGTVPDSARPPARGKGTRSGHTYIIFAQKARTESWLRQNLTQESRSLTNSISDLPKPDSARVGGWGTSSVGRQGSRRFG